VRPLFALLALAGVLAVAPPARAADPGAPTTPRIEWLYVAAWSPGEPVVLDWYPSGGNGDIHYVVFRDGVRISDTVDTYGLSDTNAPTGTSVTYQVMAYDDQGRESDLSEPATVFVDVTPPSVPQDLRVERGTHDDTLSWDASADDHSGVFYVVYRDGEIEMYESAPSHTFQVPAGETATFQVLAVDWTGNKSALSAPITVTGRPYAPWPAPAPAPAPAPPAAPAVPAAPASPVADLPIENIAGLFPTAAPGVAPAASAKASKPVPKAASNGRATAPKRAPRRAAARRRAGSRAATGCAARQRGAAAGRSARAPRRCGSRGPR